MENSKLSLFRICDSKKAGFTPLEKKFCPFDRIKKYMSRRGLKPQDIERHRAGFLTGFTLMEVIVAIAILAISFVMVMQLFSGGLRTSRLSCDYTRAIVHAKDIMEELSLEPVQASGKFEDGFEWESDVQPFDNIQETLNITDYNVLKIKVKVSWIDTRNKKRSSELISLKTMVKE